MNFQQAEEQYRALDQLRAAGQMNWPDFVAHVELLRVMANDGTLWQLQAGSGTWYVYRDGQWAAALPEPRGQPPSMTAAPPVPRPRNLAQPRRPLGLMVALGVAGTVVVLLLLVVIGVAAYFLYFRSPGSGPTSAGQTTFAKQTVTVAKADGVAVADAHGVSLTAPTGSLDGDISAQLTSYKASGALVQALGSQYDSQMPFYAITAQGKSGSTRTLGLSFPAPSPQSRILAVIDQQYPAVLGVLPENGTPPAQARSCMT